MLGFAPDALGSFPGELEVCYEGGRTAYVELRGDGVEVDVGLSTSKLELLATFIHTQSQRTFHIANNSSSSINFEFKASRPRPPRPRSAEQGCRPGLRCILHESLPEGVAKDAAPLRRPA